MLFECFYYPSLIDNKIIKSYKNLIEFKFGDKVPTKTLYYNYGESFIIHHGEEFFKVEDGVLTNSIDFKDISFPTNIVFNKGNQLRVSSAKELKSIRLVLKGEFELEKKLGNLFFLYNCIMTKIKHTQYDILSILTNSSRDFIFINDELDINTKQLITDLSFIKSQICNLLSENPDLEDSYLNYMNFGLEENIFNLSIYKYFIKTSNEYKGYSYQISKSKKSCPKSKLYNMIKSCSLDCNELS